MMKALVFLFCIFGIAQSFACSVDVNENYAKNFLIAHAASFNELSLGSVSGVTVTNYEHSFSGGEGPASCPDFFTASAKVTMSFSSKVKSCTYSVNVVHKTYVGEGVPEGAIEEVTFPSGTVSCSKKSNGARVSASVPEIIPRPVVVRPLPN